MWLSTKLKWTYVTEAKSVKWNTDKYENFYYRHTQTQPKFQMFF